MRRGVGSRTALNEIVHSTLDDECVHSRLHGVETSRDLVGALTVDAVIVDHDPLVGLLCPVRPLVALVDLVAGYQLSDVSDLGPSAAFQR